MISAPTKENVGAFFERPRANTVRPYEKVSHICVILSGASKMRSRSGYAQDNKWLILISAENFCFSLRF